jgi:hypothetical protein
LAIVPFEGEFAARDLQALNEIAGAHEQHAPSKLNAALWCVEAAAGSFFVRPQAVSSSRPALWR